jgi:hypothetical protein
MLLSIVRAVVGALHVLFRGPLAVVPDRVPDKQGMRERFAAQGLGVGAHDQNCLVTGSVEDAHPPAIRQVARGVPEKIVLQSRRDRDA